MSSDVTKIAELECDPTVQAVLQARERAGKGLVRVTALQTDTPEALQQIAGALADLIGTLNPVEMYTPGNTVSEKEQFDAAVEAGGIYLPRFTYPVAEQIPAEAIRRRLDVLHDELCRVEVAPDNRAGRWYRDTLEERICGGRALADLADGLSGRTHGGLTGDALTKHALARLYWPSDADDLHRAEEDFRRRTVNERITQARVPRFTAGQTAYLRGRKATPEETQAIFRRVAERLTLADIVAILIRPEATAMDVRHSSQLLEDGHAAAVIIPADREQADSAFSLSYLAEHELRGHLRQSRNGELLFIRLCGGRLAPKDETLYEGLAMFLEGECIAECFGAREEEPPYPYAFPTAVALAECGATFHEVAMDQRERYLRAVLHVPVGTPLPSRGGIDAHDWSEAQYWGWRTAFRVMRGHRDMGNHERFAMCKDLAYERGLRIHRGLVARGLGLINQAGIFTRTDLLRVAATFDIRPEDLPVADRAVAEEVLQPFLAEMPA